MNIIGRILLCVWLFTKSQTDVEGADGAGTVVSCYLGTWAVYRPSPGAFNIRDINPKLCTHLIYSFVGLNATTNTIRSIDAYHDLEENYGKGSFRKMTNLKKDNPHLKVTLAVGGWNEGSENYSIMASSPQTRKSFVQSCLDFVVKYNFDGIDIDWEFPTTRGGRPEDKDNFSLLIKELKSAFTKRKLLVTAAINAAPNTIANAYDLPEISKYLDFIHVMTYDYHGQWDGKVGANAPLNSSDNLDVETTIKYLISHGASSEKLVIGLAAYGHTFKVKDGVQPGLNAAAESTSFQGPYTKQDGFMGYNEICSQLQKNSLWQALWDPSSSTPYAINGNQVIAYDNERSIALKVEMALKYNVAGFMVWSIDTDDFRGDCDINRDTAAALDSRSFPLLRSIHRTVEEFDFSSNEIPDSTNSAPFTRCSSIFYATLIFIVYYRIF